VIAGFGLDQLGRHTHPVPGAAHAAFEDVSDSQLPPDVPDIDGRILVGEGRVARDHEQ